MKQSFNFIGAGQGFPAAECKPFTGRSIGTHGLLKLLVSKVEQFLE
jgi:hypothetical protein